MMTGTPVKPHYGYLEEIVNKSSPQARFPHA